MKKLLISATLLIGMMAGALVFCSFTSPKEQVETLTSIANNQDDWKEVGEYYGYNDRGGRISFIIWEKSGMCGAYYWTVREERRNNPDKAQKGMTGKLKQNDEKKWYAAYGSQIYIIKDF